MATFDTPGFSQYYELLGNPSNPPVLLLSGLGGTGASWKSQLRRFTEKYYVILPDQRGTGLTTRATDGYTTRQLAADVAALISYLAIGPVHVVGSSTGGAIAQYLALDHASLVTSVVLSSSFASFDPFMKRQFEVRRKMAGEWDRYNLLSGYALFLFSPEFTIRHPEKVTEWIERAAAHKTTPLDHEIALQRIDMIAVHDTRDRLQTIRKPTLVLSGTHNLCTLPQNSEALARMIPGAELVLFSNAGELIEIELEEKYFETVSQFLDRN